MNQSIEHVEASQGAEFSVAQMLEANAWKSMEWWHHSAGVNLYAVERVAGEPNGLTVMQAVGHLWRR